MVPGWMDGWMPTCLLNFIGNTANAYGLRGGMGDTHHNFFLLGKMNMVAFHRLCPQDC